MYVAQPIEVDRSGVVMLDQRRLPAEENLLHLQDYCEVAKAIREMVIRRRAGPLVSQQAMGVCSRRCLTRAPTSVG